MASGKAVEHAATGGDAHFIENPERILLGKSGVDDDRLVQPRSQSQLRGKGHLLEIARAMVIVIVKATFAHGHGLGMGKRA